MLWIIITIFVNPWLKCTFKFLFLMDNIGPFSLCILLASHLSCQDALRILFLRLHISINDLSFRPFFFNLFHSLYLELFLSFSKQYSSASKGGLASALYLLFILVLLVLYEFLGTIFNSQLFQNLLFFEFFMCSWLNHLMKLILRELLLKLFCCFHPRSNSLILNCLLILSLNLSDLSC